VLTSLSVATDGESGLLCGGSFGRGGVSKNAPSRCLGGHPPNKSPVVAGLRTLTRRSSFKYSVQGKNQPSACRKRRFEIELRNPFGRKVRVLGQVLQVLADEVFVFVKYLPLI
jgi:hypothetical protein